MLTRDAVEDVTFNNISITYANEAIADKPAMMSGIDVLQSRGFKKFKKYKVFNVVLKVVKVCYII